MQALKHEKSYYNSKFFKWRQRIGFGISDYACNLAYLLVNTYLLFYYTNCAGLAAGAVGVMFVVTKFVDAFTDYMVGALVDHTDTKMGRYRPWMLFGAPVLAVGMVLVFSVPVSWSAGAKLAWAYVTYIFYSFGYTLVNVPMVPIVSALSPDPIERTNISTTRTIFSNLGSLTTSLFTLPLVYFFAGSSEATGAALAVGYRNTNIILGITVIIIFCLCVFNTEEINPPTVATEKSSLLQDLKYVFNNKYFILLILFCFSYFLGYLGMYASIQYYYTYIIGDVSAMTTALTLLTLCGIPAMLGAAFMNSHGIIKRNIIQIGNIVTIVGFLVLFLTKNLTVATITLVFIGLGNGLRMSMFFSIMPDVFDYTEYKCGRNLGGTQNAVDGFANKLASASASALVSTLLVWGAYDATKMDEAMAAGGTALVASEFPSAITAINFAFGGLSMVASIACFIIMLFYDLDGKMPEIRETLEKRKAELGQTVIDD